MSYFFFKLFFFVLFFGCANILFLLLDCYSPNSGGAFAQRALDKSSKSFRKTGNDSNILDTKDDEFHEFRTNEIIKMPQNNRTPEHHCMGTKFSTMGSTQGNTFVSICLSYIINILFFLSFN